MYIYIYVCNTVFLCIAVDFVVFSPNTKQNKAGGFWIAILNCRNVLLLCLSAVGFKEILSHLEYVHVLSPGTQAHGGGVSISLPSPNTTDFGSKLLAFWDPSG